MSQIVIVGNLLDNPSLRFTKDGKAVTNFGVAVNRRIGSGDDAKDEATFYRVTAWESLAENVAASLSKGDRVIVDGDFYARPFEDKEGNERLSLDVKANHVGPELRWATATPTRNEKTDKPRKAASQPEFDDEPF